MIKIIVYECLVKRSFSDLVVIDIFIVDVFVFQVVVKFDIFGRFFFFNFGSKLLVDSFGRFILFNLKFYFFFMMGQFLSLSWFVGRSEYRRQFVVNVEVFKERVDFFKIFLTLFNMGLNFKKEKDVKGVKEKMSYRRQISLEQELW